MTAKTFGYSLFIKFVTELVLQCVVNKQPVPIPAFETLEDRLQLPRRYFLFFDVFFQAGRHNKDLWKVAITKDKGKNGIPPVESCIAVSTRWYVP